jgi:excisionase family DNA binding protein
MVLLSLSRSVIYELIRAGRLRTVAEGGARRVPAAPNAQ